MKYKLLSEKRYLAWIVDEKGIPKAKAIKAANGTWYVLDLERQYLGHAGDKNGALEAYITLQTFCNVK